MFKSKSYIHNKSRLEGSTVEGCLAECMTFVFRYLNGIETSLNWPRRKQEYDDNEVDTRIDKYRNIGRALSSKRAITYDSTELEDMHSYMLFNRVTIDSYLV